LFFLCYFDLPFLISKIIFQDQYNKIIAFTHWFVKRFSASFFQKSNGSKPTVFRFARIESKQGSFIFHNKIRKSCFYYTRSFFEIQSYRSVLFNFLLYKQKGSTEIVKTAVTITVV